MQMHEGKAGIFFVFSCPRKFKKCFSRNGALPISNFFPLFQSPIPLSLLNHAPISLMLRRVASRGILLISILHDVSNILSLAST